MVDPRPLLKQVIVHYLKKKEEHAGRYQPGETLLDATMPDPCKRKPELSHPGMPYFKFLQPTVRTTETIPECCYEEEVKTTDSKVPYISLDVPSNPKGPFTMEDAVLKHCLHGAPTVTVPCSECGALLRRYEKVELVKPSKALVVRMNRIRSDSIGHGQVKITTPVLEANGLTLPLPGAKRVVNYTLVAAVRHTGLPQGGHYKTYVVVDKVWFEVNDDLPITRVPAKVIEDCQLFFYTKSDFQLRK